MDTLKSHFQSTAGDLSFIKNGEWSIDCERINHHYPFLMIYFQGRFSFNRDHKKILFDHLERLSENHNQVIIDMNDVHYISSVFLDALVCWSIFRRKNSMFSGVTGINNHIRTILKKMGAFKSLHDMPIDRNLWFLHFEKHIKKNIIYRLKEMFSF